MRSLIIALAALIITVQPQPAPTLTTRWIDAQHIEICASAPGALYVAGAWAWVGDIDAGCRTFPPEEWELIDAVYAPEPGKVYCLATETRLTCAKPLSRQRYKVILPVVAR